MKMIFAVIRDKDSYAAIGALSEKNIGVTKLASSGGFLREGNTTLMIGVEDSRVEEVMGILRENCAKRTQIDVAAPYPIGGAPFGTIIIAPSRWRLGEPQSSCWTYQILKNCKRTCGQRPRSRQTGAAF